MFSICKQDVGNYHIKKDTFFKHNSKK